MNRRVGQFLPILAVLTCFISPVAHAQTFRTHHMRQAAQNSQARMIGRMPADQVMQLNVVLPLRDEAGLKQFLVDLSNPASPDYRKFITPAEFTAKFGPTQADYDAAVAYLKANGLTVVGGSRDGMEVQVKGPVSAVESAFHVHMRTYQHPTENRTFYAPDREPTTTLSFSSGTSPAWTTTPFRIRCL